MAAEESGQFVYIPAEEGGDVDPAASKDSASHDKPPAASVPVSPPSPTKSPTSKPQVSDGHACASSQFTSSCQNASMQILQRQLFPLVRKRT